MELDAVNRPVDYVFIDEVVQVLNEMKSGNTSVSSDVLLETMLLAGI